MQVAGGVQPSAVSGQQSAPEKCPNLGVQHSYELWVMSYETRGAGVASRQHPATSRQPRSAVRGLRPANYSCGALMLWRRRAQAAGGVQPSAVSGLQSAPEKCPNLGVQHSYELWVMSYETRGAGVASHQPSAASIQSRGAGRGQPSASSHQQPAAACGLRSAYTVPIVIDTPLFEKPPFFDRGSTGNPTFWTVQ